MLFLFKELNPALWVTAWLCVLCRMLDCFQAPNPDAQFGGTLPPVGVTVHFHFPIL